MIFFDTETTGLLMPSPSDVKLQPYITELCMIKLDNEGEYVDELTTFIKPPVPIPEEITKITGITEEMLEDAPYFIQVYDKICDFVLGEAEIVAHNAPFDIGMLKYELERLDKVLNFPWPKRHICTVEQSYQIQNRRLSLAKLHTLATGAPHEGAHRAREDVLALIRCYFWLDGNSYLD